MGERREFRADVEWGRERARASVIDDALRVWFPDYEGREEVQNAADDMMGIDYDVRIAGGGVLSVDVKSRRRTFGGDMLVEFRHERHGALWRVGWSLDERKRTDYVLHIYEDDVILLVGFREQMRVLRQDASWFTERRTFNKRSPSSESYTTIWGFARLQEFRVRGIPVMVWRPGSNGGGERKQQRGAQDSLPLSELWARRLESTPGFQAEAAEYRSAVEKHRASH